MNYSRKTLKKCWKFGENVWGILDWLCRSILNIFMKSRKNVKKLLKNYRVNINNFEKIVRKHPKNFILLILWKLQRISKMFLWNFSKIIAKKIWRNVGNTSYKFINILMEILWHFLVNFWKNSEKLWEKYEKYFMVSVSFENAVITLCIVTVLNISPLQNS